MYDKSGRMENRSVPRMIEYNSATIDRGVASERQPSRPQHVMFHVCAVHATPHGYSTEQKMPTDRRRPDTKTHI